MSGPSEKAVQAGREAAAAVRVGESLARATIEAAHDPALGDERSVCARTYRQEVLNDLAVAFGPATDGTREQEYAVLFAMETIERIRREVVAEVVGALRVRQWDPADGRPWRVAADFIEREFGGGS